MRISVPVTDYIPASILTTPNDIVVRGAADPARQPALIRAIGIHVGELTRDSSGTQVITGVPFSSSLIAFFATDADLSVPNLSWGFGNVAFNMCTRLGYVTLHGGIENALCISVKAAGVKYIEAYVSVVSNEGFSLVWDNSGTITANVVFWCIP